MSTTLVDGVYIEVKRMRNKLRLEKDTDPEILRFLVHIMNMIESENRQF